MVCFIILRSRLRHQKRHPEVGIWRQKVRGTSTTMGFKAVPFISHLVVFKCQYCATSTSTYVVFVFCAQAIMQRAVICLYGRTTPTTTIDVSVLLFKTRMWRNSQLRITPSEDIMERTVTQYEGGDVQYKMTCDLSAWSSRRCPQKIDNFFLAWAHPSSHRESHRVLTETVTFRVASGFVLTLTTF